MDIPRHNQQFLKQKGRLRLYVGNTATVVLRYGEEYRQICQLGYMRDGSIYVQWPYLTVEQGIVASVILPRASGEQRVELREWGKFTSQLVKFVHHASGTVHFSQTGRVRTEIRRESYPLDGPIGRIFELSVFYPLQFKRLARLKSGRVYLSFEAHGERPLAIQLRGDWRRKKSVTANAVPKGASVGPFTEWMHKASGEISPVFLFGPPLESPIRDKLLGVSCHVVPVPHGASRPGLVFMGGFDAHEVAGKREPRPAALRSFLVAMYPSNAPEEIASAIGSIDLN